MSAPTVLQLIRNALIPFGLIVGVAATACFLPQPADPPTPDEPTIVLPAVHGTPKPPVEGEPGFDCRTQGNRICGPGSNFPAGCYNDGVRVIPWTNYTDPKLDPLWAKLQSPC